MLLNKKSDFTVGQIVYGVPFGVICRICGSDTKSFEVDKVNKFTVELNFLNTSSYVSLYIESGVDIIHHNSGYRLYSSLEEAEGINKTNELYSKLEKSFKENNIPYTLDKLSQIVDILNS